uniref:Uncharacterized protein n=1 Tax=Sphaerodactylus townsendi TaxID=933632 RepID=A0ACB8G3V7_9SAUR
MEMEFGHSRCSLQWSAWKAVPAAPRRWVASQNKSQEVLQIIDKVRKPRSHSVAFKGCLRRLGEAIAGTAGQKWYPSGGLIFVLGQESDLDASALLLRFGCKLLHCLDHQSDPQSSS